MIRTFLRRRGTAAATAAALLVLAAAAPVQAAEAERHCLEFLDDGTVVCADSLEGATAAFVEETGYTPVTEEAARGDVGVLLAFSLATLYADVGYNGASHTFVRTSDCNGVTISGLTSLSTAGLDNAVSSFLTYRTCQVRLFDGTGYSGSSYGFTTSKTSLPGFNNIASSAQVR